METLPLSDEARSLLRRIFIDNQSIAFRHMGMDALSDALQNSQDELIARYKKFAVPVAVEAASKALADVGLAPNDVHALVVNTCTGYLCPGLTSYVAPCDGDITLVALLLEEKAMKFFKGNLAQGYVDFLRAAEGFRERIREGELFPPVQAVGPLGFKVEPIYRPGLLLIGDSAGFLDPITGEGMTLALKSVQAALPVINEAFITGGFEEDILARYAREGSRIIEDVFKLTQFMLDAARFKWLANRAIRRLGRDGPLFQKLLGIVTGAHRYRDFTLKDRLALVWG